MREDEEGSQVKEGGEGEDEGGEEEGGGKEGGGGERISIRGNLMC